MYLTSHLLFLVVLGEFIIDFFFIPYLSVDLTQQTTAHNALHKTIEGTPSGFLRNLIHSYKRHEYWLGREPKPPIWRQLAMGDDHLRFKIFMFNILWRVESPVSLRPTTLHAGYKRINTTLLTIVNHNKWSFGAVKNSTWHTYTL